MTRRATIDRQAVREAVELARDRTHAPIAVSIAPFFIGSVDRAARRAFAGLRASVLVFVVPARGQVIVLADEVTRAAVDSMLWHDIATHIAGEFARGRGTLGLVGGVGRLADALSQRFGHPAESSLG